MIDAVKWPNIANSEQLPQLAHVQLVDNDITIEGFRYLLHSELCSRIHTLNLNSNYLGSDSARLIAQTNPFQSLKVLDLSETGLGTKGVGILVMKCSMPHLRKLYLSQNNIGPLGAKAIADSCYSRCLEVLSMYHNPLGSDGISFLARGNFQNLTELNIHGVKAESMLGVQDLAKSNRFPVLRELMTEYNDERCNIEIACSITLPLFIRRKALRGIAKEELARHAITFLSESNLSDVTKTELVEKIWKMKSCAGSV